MTDNKQKEIDFANKWHNKIVKIINYYELPDKEYVVTAALYKFEGDISIFAIRSLEYSIENSHWFTLKLSPEEVDSLSNRFEVID